MNILDEIADYAGLRTEEERKHKSLDELISECRKMLGTEETSGSGDEETSESFSRETACPSARDNVFRFGEALKKEGLSIISEIKKASPSKGIISEDFPYLKIAKEYEDAGADCISCLTEPRWFLGSDAIFEEVRRAVGIPMIRKDFVVDEYQIYQAKLIGADAALLIAALLTKDELERYLGICRELKMDALVETHDEGEIEAALSAGAVIIGVNNRNLKDFSVNFDNAERLRAYIPEDRIYVAESGVKSAEDVKAVKALGADAVLIGETLMRAEDKAALIREFKEI